MVGRTARQGVVLNFVMRKGLNKKILFSENLGCPFPTRTGFQKVIITSNVARIPLRRPNLGVLLTVHKTWQGSISCADMNGCSHSKTSSCSAWFWFNLVLTILTIVGNAYMIQKNCKLKEKCCKCCTNLEKEDENPNFGFRPYIFLHVTSNTYHTSFRIWNIYWINRGVENPDWLKNIAIHTSLRGNTPIKSFDIKMTLTFLFWLFQESHKGILQKTNRFPPHWW